MKYNVFLSLIIYAFFLRLAQKSDPLIDFNAPQLKDVTSCKNVLFEAITLTFNINPLFILQNRQNLTQNWT